MSDDLMGVSFMRLDILISYTKIVVNFICPVFILSL